MAAKGRTATESRGDGISEAGTVTDDPKRSQPYADPASIKAFRPANVAKSQLRPNLSLGRSFIPRESV